MHVTLCVKNQLDGSVRKDHGRAHYVSKFRELRNTKGYKG